MAKGLMKMRARGESMRNDVAQAMTGEAQHPQNKDPEDVTPGPQYQQGEPTDEDNSEAAGGESGPVKIMLPKALQSKKHQTGAKVMHLAEGHHVKNADGSTSFHMHSLDGEPISADDVEPKAQDTEDGGSGNGANMGTSSMIDGGDPYGVRAGLRGMS